MKNPRLRIITNQRLFGSGQWWIDDDADNRQITQTVWTVSSKSLANCSVELTTELMLLWCHNVSIMRLYDIVCSDFCCSINSLVLYWTGYDLAASAAPPRSLFALSMTTTKTLQLLGAITTPQQQQQLLLLRPQYGITATASPLVNSCIIDNPSYSSHDSRAWFWPSQTWMVSSQQFPLSHWVMCSQSPPVGVTLTTHYICGKTSNWMSTEPTEQVRRCMVSNSTRDWLHRVRCIVP